MYHILIIKIVACSKIKIEIRMTSHSEQKFRIWSCAKYAAASTLFGGTSSDVATIIILISLNNELNSQVSSLLKTNSFLKGLESRQMEDRKTKCLALATFSFVKDFTKGIHLFARNEFNLALLVPLRVHLHWAKVKEKAKNCLDNCRQSMLNVFQEPTWKR